MKFIFDKKSGAFFNIDAIRTLSLSRIYDIDHGMPPKPTKNFHISAEMVDEYWLAILEEFISEDEKQNFESAKKYFDELLADLSKKIEFIFDDSGFNAVNAAFVRKLVVECFSGDGGYFVFVTARLYDEDEEDEGFNLKTFSSGNKEKDIEDAEIYLENLIKKLNGGTL